MVRENVGFAITLYAVKRTKRAEFFAHIGVVDISINDVADDIVRMQTYSHSIRRSGEIQQVCVFEQTDSLIRRDSSTFCSRIQNGMETSHKNSTPRWPLLAPIRAAFS